MSPINDLSVEPIDQRLQVLKKRQRNIVIGLVASIVLMVLTIAAFFLQKEFIYRFFDLSLHVQSLDLPYQVQELVPFKQPVDYFFNLLSWFGWLFLKVLVSFVGAFLIVRWVKKFKFFQQRFQAWTQRFLAWIISFMLLWSGLSYIQYDWKNETEEAYQRWMSYQTNIVESQIAQDLQDINISQTEKAYVLAQVALLHDPIDRKTANIYVNQLIEAEKKVPTEFRKYDFKPEQLWVMQQQLYGKSITLITQPLDIQAQQAEKISKYVNFFLLVFLIINLAMSVVLYMLAKHFKNRRYRITQKLDL